MSRVLCIGHSLTLLGAGGEFNSGQAVQLLPIPVGTDPVAWGKGERPDELRYFIGGDQAGTLRVFQGVDLTALNLATSAAPNADDLSVAVVAHGGVAATVGTVAVTAPYARAIYTNGGVAQGTFSLWVGAFSQ